MIGKMTQEEYETSVKDAHEKSEIKSNKAFELLNDFNKRLKDNEFDDDEIIRIFSFGLQKQLVEQGVAIFSYMRNFQSSYDNFMISHLEEQEAKYEPEKVAKRKEEAMKKSEHINQPNLKHMEVKNRRKM